MESSAQGSQAEDLERVRRAVQEAIYRDPLVPGGAEIGVEPVEGVVVLRGQVPNGRTKRVAGDDAWWAAAVVGGTRGVDNQLEIVGRGVRKPAGPAYPEELAPTEVVRGGRAQGERSRVHRARRG